jgi:hypothetical protein
MTTAHTQQQKSWKLISNLLGRFAEISSMCPDSHQGAVTEGNGGKAWRKVILRGPRSRLTIYRILTARSVPRKAAFTTGGLQVEMAVLSGCLHHFACRECYFWLTDSGTTHEPISLHISHNVSSCSIAAHSDTFLPKLGASPSFLLTFSCTSFHR